jgi:bifunctional non-homologous end joining protein LigD
VAGNPKIRFSEEMPGEVATITSHAKEFGIEGIVAKRRDSRYVPGDRSKDWLKLKLDRRQAFVVGGYKPPAPSFDSLVVGYYDVGRLRFAAQVRNRFNPGIRRQIAPLLQKFTDSNCPFIDLPQKGRGRFWQGITAADMSSFRWIKPQVVVDVEFVEWTNAGILRHPKYRGLRADTDPLTVTRE